MAVDVEVLARRYEDLNGTVDNFSKVLCGATHDKVHHQQERSAQHHAVVEQLSRLEQEITRLATVQAMNLTTSFMASSRHRSIGSCSNVTSPISTYAEHSSNAGPSTASSSAPASFSKRRWAGRATTWNHHRLYSRTSCATAHTRTTSRSHCRTDWVWLLSNKPFIRN